MPNESNWSTPDNVRFGRAGPRIGEGCLTRSGNNVEHNPKFSTPRGEKRHTKRNSEQKKHAEATWGKPRTNRKSRYEKVLGNAHR